MCVWCVAFLLWLCLFFVVSVCSWYDWCARAERLCLTLQTVETVLKSTRSQREKRREKKHTRKEEEEERKKGRYEIYITLMTYNYRVCVRVCVGDSNLALYQLSLCLGEGKTTHHSNIEFKTPTHITQRHRDRWMIWPPYTHSRHSLLMPLLFSPRDSPPYPIERERESDQPSDRNPPHSPFYHRLVRLFLIHRLHRRSVVVRFCIGRVIT